MPTNSSRYQFSWATGLTKIRTLHRSFNTLEEAQKFAEGKHVTDIYRCNDKYKVEWLKKYRAFNRAFDTHEDATAFAKGKMIESLYEYKGKYEVAWLEEVELEG